MKSAAERSREYRRRRGAQPRGELKPCGTVAAARRHQRAGEPLCGPCAEAWRQHQAAMYQQRKKK